MRCVYLGLPEGASALAGAGHEVLAVGLTRRARGEPLELVRSCPVLFRPNMEVPMIQQLFLTAGAELLVCYLWDRIVPAAVVELGLAAISYHPSLLPRHRGADPYFWTIWSSDEEGGVTVLRLDGGVDTGSILDQRKVPLSEHLDAGDLASRLDALGLDLLLEVLGRWERDGPLEGRPQDDALATNAPAPDDDLLEIRWSWPAEEIARLIRAAAPHPGAFTALDVDGEIRTLVVLAAHPHEVVPPRGLSPGEATLVDGGVMICTGKGGLILDAVHLDGEEPRRGARAITDLLSRLQTFSGTS